jgi:hypothetical protein
VIEAAVMAGTIRSCVALVNQIIAAGLFWLGLLMSPHPFSAAIVSISANSSGTARLLFTPQIPALLPSGLIAINIITMSRRLV